MSHLDLPLDLTHPELLPAEESILIETMGNTTRGFNTLEDSTIDLVAPVPASTGPWTIETPALTPLHEYVPDLAMRTIAGAALPPSPTSSLSPTPLKGTNNLQLPSFDLLGIAAPHPDRIGENLEHTFLGIGAGPLSKPEDPLHIQSPILGRAHMLPDKIFSASSNEAPAIQHFVPTFTPPYDGTINWDPITEVRTSPANTETTPGARPDSTTIPPTDGINTAMQITPSLSHLGRNLSWLDEMLDTILASLNSSTDDRKNVMVLTHALPCPSPEGHVFPRVINAINDRASMLHHTTPSRRTVWISVYHAVPGRFNMADLPTSPPSTPGPAIDGEDYFATKILDNAVTITDYQGDLQRMPSPRPVALPETINVSIVERYIPPTKPTEFAEMFNLNTQRSLLLDRLVELSPDRGHLLFVYPTEAGAKTFLKKYLNPIIEALLREMIVVHGLPSRLAEEIGYLESVAKLLEYARIMSHLQTLCNQLNDPTSNLGRWGVLRSGKYRVVHASRQEVFLDRAVWARDWWSKQEKQRVRDILKKLPGTSNVSATELMAKFMDGIVNREADTPTEGVEVCVFMIEKTAS